MCVVAVVVVVVFPKGNIIFLTGLSCHSLVKVSSWHVSKLVNSAPWQPRWCTVHALYSVRGCAINCCSLQIIVRGEKQTWRDFSNLLMALNHFSSLLSSVQDTEMD